MINLMSNPVQIAFFDGSRIEYSTVDQSALPWLASFMSFWTV